MLLYVHFQKVKSFFMNYYIAIRNKKIGVQDLFYK